MEHDIAAGHPITPDRYPFEAVLAHPIEINWNQISSGVGQGQFDTAVMSDMVR